MNEIISTKFGNVRVNTQGYYEVCTSKEGNYHKTLHRLMYESFYGEIPKGFIIHHKNGNKLDNCILNLQLVKNENHSQFHNSGENNYLFKNYARIVKAGVKNNRQNYAIKFNTKVIKESYYPHKLVKWFTETYPKVILHLLTLGENPTLNG